MMIFYDRYFHDTDHEPVVIKSQEITQVSSYKYLGVHIDDFLCWKTHIDNLCNRLHAEAIIRIEIKWD